MIQKHKHLSLSSLQIRPPWILLVRRLEVHVSLTIETERITVSEFRGSSGVDFTISGHRRYDKLDTTKINWIRQLSAEFSQVRERVRNMDCNKDEAMRAKEIAVRKFLDKDVMGAAKFAQKAQKLYPELEGISRLVANLELHMSAKFRRNGEMDWYRMLGVHPSADTDIITKQYRKLALLIHPDKSREVGSESAFKLLNDAFRVLKDKNERAIYDHKANAQSFQQNYTSQAKYVPVVPTAPTTTQTKYSRPSDWSQFKKTPQSGGPPPNTTTFQQKDNNVGGSSGPPPRPVNKKAMKTSGNEMGNSSTSRHHNRERTTFWTCCSGCKMQFQYLREYVNKYLLCPNCATGYHAIEIPTPSMWQVSDKSFSFSRRENEIDAKPAVKRPKKGRSSDASNGNLETKRQKVDGSSKRKPKTDKTKVDAKNK